MLIELWKDSKDHHKNMLDDWTHTGIGVVVDSDGMVFATQIFSTVSYFADVACGSDSTVSDHAGSGLRIRPPCPRPPMDRRSGRGGPRAAGRPGRRGGSDSARGFSCPGLDDSKKISAAKREALYESLTGDPEVIWAVATADREEIDRLNILRATHLAMRRAVGGA